MSRKRRFLPLVPDSLLARSLRRKREKFLPFTLFPIVFQLLENKCNRFRLKPCSSNSFISDIDVFSAWKLEAVVLGKWTFKNRLRQNVIVTASNSFWNIAFLSPLSWSHCWTATHNGLKVGSVTFKPATATIQTLRPFLSEDICRNRANFINF